MIEVFKEKKRKEYSNFKNNNLKNIFNKESFNKLSLNNKLIKKKLSYGLFFFLIIFYSFLIINNSFSLKTNLFVPENATEGNINITFFIDENASIELMIDGNTLLSFDAEANKTYNYEWDATPGTHDIYLEANNDLNSSSITKNILIKELPLIITILEPNESDYNHSDINLRIKVNKETDFCYYSYDENNHLMNKNRDNTFSSATILDDGLYTIEFKCIVNEVAHTNSTTIKIDTTPPEFDIIKEEVYNSDPLIKINTNEISECFIWPYDEGLIFNYDNKQKLDTDNNLNHKLRLNLNNGDYNYYVACKDVYENHASPKLISFKVDKPITGTLSFKNPLIAGENNLLLTLNQEINKNNDLELTYTLQNGNKGKIILFPKENKDFSKEWEGKFYVPKEQGEETGEFKAYLKKKEITLDNNIFDIDTFKPEKISGLKIDVKFKNYNLKNKNGLNNSKEPVITLSWNKINDDIDHYNIYGSNTPIFNENDKIGETKNNYYVLSEKYNFYAVSAVDEANNEGELNSIEFSYSSEESPDINFLVKNIEQKILDLEQSYKSLETERDETKIKIIKELNLLEKIASEKNILISLKKSNNEELIKNELKKADSLIIKRILVTGKVSYQQPFDDNIISLIFNNVKEILSLNKNNLDSTFDLMTKSNILTTINSYEIDFADRHREFYTLIEKKISYPLSKNKLYLVEYLGDLNTEPIFNSKLNLLEEKKYYQTELPLTTTKFYFKYLLNKKIDLINARNTYTLLLTKDSEEKIENKLIGNVVGSNNLSSFNWFYIISLIIIAGLVIYYFSMDLTDNAQLKQNQNLGLLNNNFQSNLRNNLQNNIPFFYYPNTFFIRKPLSRRRIRVKNNSKLNNTYENKEHNSEKNLNMPLSDLIKESEKLINNKEFEKAKKYYSEAIKQSEFINLTKEEHQSLLRIYNKLRLYSIINKAFFYSENKDLTKLEETLSLIKKIASLLPEENIKLINEAKILYKELYKIANKLAIEKDNL